MFINFKILSREVSLEDWSLHALNLPANSPAVLIPPSLFPSARFIFAMCRFQEMYQDHVQAPVLPFPPSRCEEFFLCQP